MAVGLAVLRYSDLDFFCEAPAARHGPGPDERGVHPRPMGGIRCDFPVRRDGILLRLESKLRRYGALLGLCCCCPTRSVVCFSGAVRRRPAISASTVVPMDLLVIFSFFKDLCANILGQLSLLYPSSTCLYLYESVSVFLTY
ncbi:hypothetical protein GQ55_5G039000 [Panicum hallii var. hallii]|uniref:Uncharacterized protein n=1 Tax=Panicum hallii var. hallii TaxID=1504633 RepID=A0A2T7DCG8_9POAL|nr:hypothetical protein GQ55_5G039000 [Panicum hallii var. hallii]